MDQIFHLGGKLGVVCTSVVPALQRQRPEDPYEFEASLVYGACSRPPRLHRDLVFSEHVIKCSCRRGFIQIEVFPMKAGVSHASAVIPTGVPRRKLRTGESRFILDPILPSSVLVARFSTMRYILQKQSASNPSDSLCPQKQGMTGRACTCMKQQDPFQKKWQLSQ